MKGYAELLLLLAVGGLPVGATAAEITLPELMRTLAQVERANARFIETRHSPLLKAPLVLRGTLSYRRPGRLEKHVLSPYDERIVIDGGQVTIENRTRGWNKVLSIDAAPGLAGLVESIRATRAGELQALERFYVVESGGSREHWWLRLKPHAPEIAQYVNAVTIKGSGPRIERIETEETSGDQTTMEISEQFE